MNSENINFLDVDFIEIGTSDFDTLIEKADDNTVGFSIEPISFYLDNLPNKSNVKKINRAIVAKSLDATTIDVYFIPSEIILKHKLPIYLKGCNCINDYHPLHKKLKCIDFVQKQTVQCQSIENFFKEFRIRRINYLKIDTEGHDVYLMKDLYEYLVPLDKSFYPKKIRFESNQLSNKKDIQNIIDIFNSLNYTSCDVDGYNIDLDLNI